MMANFRNAVAVLFLIAATAAEEPYILPRPGPGQPAFNLPGPSLSVPPPPLPSQPFNPSTGYNYQQPGAFGKPGLGVGGSFGQSGVGIGGSFGQSGISGSFGQSGISGSFGQSGISGSFGQSGLGANFGSNLPGPLPTPPATSYGLPQLNNPTAFRTPGNIPPVPPTGLAFGQNSFGQQGPLGSRPELTGQFQSGAFGSQSGLPFQAGQTSFQSQQFLNQPGQLRTGGGLAGFETGSNFFSRGLGGALDGPVVDRVQNLITQTEQNAAREAGFFGRISGVQFGQPRPGIEIASFVHNGPVSPSFFNGQRGFGTDGFGSTGFGAESFGSRGFGARGLEGGLGTGRLGAGLPNGGLTGSSLIEGSSQFDKGFGFLPNQKPAAVYGNPGKK